MSEWREFEKFSHYDFPDVKDTSDSKINVHAQSPVFKGKLSIRKDMVGAFEEAFEDEITRVYLKFGGNIQSVKCPYPEFFDWVTT